MKAITLIFPICLLLSCGFFKKKEEEKKAEGNPIARVNDKFLYSTDAEVLGINPDSNMLKSFSSAWIQKEILLLKAESLVDENDPEILKKVNQYKESLLIEKYRDLYLKQNLDSNFTGKEITYFYDSHPDVFKLKTDLVKGLKIVLPVSDHSIGELEEQLRSTKKQDKRNLKTFCARNSVDCSLNDSIWFDAREYIKRSPFTINDLESKGSGFLEKKDSKYHYLLYIKDLKKSGELGPVDYFKADIKKMLLIQRKNELLISLDQKLLKEAKENKEIEIY